MTATVVTAVRNNLRVILYWVVSLPVLFESVYGASWDLLRIDYVVEVFGHLGYPLYFLTIMGIAKLLAVLAIVVPRFPRLKEWAYAGIFFVYFGAALSHFAAGDGVSAIIGPLVFAGITMGSYALRPPRARELATG